MLRQQAREFKRKKDEEVIGIYLQDAVHCDETDITYPAHSYIVISNSKIFSMSIKDFDKQFTELKK